MDNGYKRLTYVRYADDFLIGIIGSKEDAQSVRDEIATFLKADLNLELSMEKNTDNKCLKQMCSISRV
ncbi:hypothetical protein GCM10020331_065650 [Ectobacillus funiculus]